ncbi:MAG TPA: heme-binding protein [Candidatus Limnocylindrales bacterium]|nr:heme-binding protein [Candidatus Limnocylindrales bacterium]
MEHVLRKPVESRRAYKQRRKTLALGMVLALGLAAALAVLVIGCGGVTTSTGGTAPAPTAAALSVSDVQNLVQAAAQAADATSMVIAVVDRGGSVLAVYRKPTAGTTAAGNFGAAVDVNDLAVALARTAAFFSNDQAPLSSRTVRFISGIHFPPGVTNTSNAALYGIENTNRGCTLTTNYLPGQSVQPSLALGGGTGLGIITGKADLNDSDPSVVNPGGVPIFRNGVVVGGVGVAGVSPDVAEYVAYTAATSNGFGPTPASPGVVYVNGIALPFVQQTTVPAGVNSGSFTGTFLTGPTASAGQPPEGDLIAPVAGPLGGLSAADVQQILGNAEATASQTRAVIRLPIGSRTKMVIAVADLDGTIIGLRRMTDSTVFSIDVAATKARNMVYFNSATRTATDLNQVPMGTAVTTRTIGFGAQPLFPPGIDGSSPGPFFNLYLQDVANPCTQGFQTGPPNNNKSGIIFFPGSVGLYRNGALVGGLGVSGDGVEQDDYVTAGGAAGFEAPTQIRADQISINGVRLPYLKFPSNPTN